MICALVTGPVVVFLAGGVVAVHCFSVSMDVGVLCLLLFLVMYCSYIRMFQNTGYVLALVPILYMLKIPFAAPVMVAIFAGFSGGRKSVLPGIASYKTIMANHSGEFINDKKSRPGNLQHNLIHEDMVYAARTAKLAFIVNVVLNGNHVISQSVRMVVILWIKIFIKPLKV